jgi:integrase
MSTFAKVLAERVEGYIELRRSLGYAFCKQAITLRGLVHYVAVRQLDGPLTQHMALDFVLASADTANGRAVRYGVLRRFCEYLAVYDARTKPLDPRILPRSRAIPPPRILSDAELGALLSACRRVSPETPACGQTLATLVGLLASTGMRSGEARRLDRADVNLVEGVLQIKKTKFRKDRLVPVHATTLAALRRYTRFRDRAFPRPTDSAFFLSSRGNRLSSADLSTAFRAACNLAGFDQCEAVRPHHLRHRFAVVRLATWHRDAADVQALLPLLATYLGHVRYSDTAYYVTATAELLGLAAERVFTDGGAA